MIPSTCASAPVADSNCSTNLGKPECVSTSGCLGGESVEEQCNTSRTGLTGMFCMICAPPPPDGEQVYYVLATSDANARCEGCGSTLGTTAALTLGAVVGAVVLARSLLALRRRYLREVAYINSAYKPINKLKILFTFCASRWSQPLTTPCPMRSPSMTFD